MNCKWMDGAHKCTEAMHEDFIFIYFNFLKKSIQAHYLLYVPDQSCSVLRTVAAMGGPQAILLHKCMRTHVHVCRRGGFALGSLISSLQSGCST